MDAVTLQAAKRYADKLSSGQPTEMRRTGDMVEWRHVGEIDWQPMIPLADITGPPGEGVGSLSAHLSFEPAGPLTVTELGSDPRPLDALDDGYLYGATGSTLYRATSPTGPWEQISTLPPGHSLQGVRQMGDGEVLVIRATDGLWKSSGWADNPTTATWTQTLDTGGGGIRQYSIDVDPVSGYVLATTYDNAPTRHLSRWAWLSKDNADTFAVVFDMEVASPQLNPDYAHMHLAVLDPIHNPARPRLWLSYHKTDADPTNSADPFKRTIYSDDDGVTWLDASTTRQPVSGAATPHGVVFGGDESPVAAYVFTRAGRMELLHTFRTSVPQFGFSTRSARGANGAVHIAFRSIIVGQSARVLTTDGLRAAETLEIPPATPSGADPGATVDLLNLIEYEGQLIGVYALSTTGATAYVFTCDAPKRGVAPSREFGGLGGGEAQVQAVAAGTGAAAGPQAVAGGDGATAGHSGVAFGFFAQAFADAIAMGRQAIASVRGGIAVGWDAMAEQGVSVGRSATGVEASTSVGTASTSEEQGTAVGAFASADGFQSTAMGHLAKALEASAVSIGALAQATVGGAIAIGRNARADHPSSVALGSAAQTTAPNQVQLGSRHIILGAAANPPVDGIPATGGALYVNGGVLKFRKADGTIIDIAGHVVAE